MTKRLNLVTGATGFSGSYVVRELLNAGEKVIATDLESKLLDPGHREVLLATGLDLNHPNVTLIPSDLLDPDTLGPLFELPITHLFHTASLYDYSASLELLQRINLEGTRNLLNKALGANLDRFIHWSTCGVFGKPYTAADGGKANVPFDEHSSSPKNTPDDAEQPQGTHLVNDYSITKWAQEKIMWKAHREQGLPLTVVRPAPIYGPGSSYGHGGIILTIAMGYAPAVTLDSKNYITTSVHAEDVARFACFIAQRDEAIGEDYNMVDNSIISYYDFLKYIALLTGRSLRDLPLIKNKHLRPLMIGSAHLWTWVSRKFDIPRLRVFEIQSSTYISSSYWLSNRKTLATGFEYKYGDVREGLKDTVAWFRKMGWLTDSKRVMISGESAKPSPTDSPG